MDLFNQGPCIFRKMGWQTLLHGKMNLDLTQRSCPRLHIIPWPSLSQRKLQQYLKESLNPEFAIYGRKKECTSVDTVIFPVSEFSKWPVSLYSYQIFLKIIALMFPSIAIKVS